MSTKTNRKNNSGTIPKFLGRNAARFSTLP